MYEEEILIKKHLGPKKSKAIWQYLIDHAQPLPDGFMVTFFVNNEDDFWKRLEARYLGRYKRNDNEDHLNRQLQMREHYKRMKRRSKRYHDVMTTIQRRGSLWQRLLLAAYQRLDAYVVHNLYKKLCQAKEAQPQSDAKN